MSKNHPMFRYPLLAGLLAMTFLQTARAVIYANSQMTGFATGNLGSVGTVEGWNGGAGYCSYTSGGGSLDGSGVGLVASAGDKATLSAAGTATYNLFISASGTLNQTAARNVYISLLYRVNTTNGILPSGANIVKMLRQNSGTSANGHIEIWIKPDGAGNIQVGTCLNQGTPTYATNLIPVGQTFFVVARQQIATGADNDIADLWINPPIVSFGAAEGSLPAPGASTNSGVEDASSTGAGRLYFYGYGGSADFDELRIASTWAEVTPAGICTPVSMGTGPVNQSAFAGGTANFSITATGSGPHYQWQMSGDAGVNWSNTGADSAAYTTPVLALADSGKQYRCIASVACDGSSATSSVASVTVADGSIYSFRSAASGNWNSPGTWEQSTDGLAWITATVIPTAPNSNITVRAGHTVTAATAITVDDIVVEAAAVLDVTGALTINNGAASVDCDVAGTLQVSAATGSITAGAAGVKFENGGKYIWKAAAAPVVPTATWANGSTCRIEATASGTVSAIGINGQSFYDLTWDTTIAGQSARTRFDLTGAATTVRRNLSITLPNTANASVTLGNAVGAVLTVGGDFTITTGTGQNSTKVLLNSAAGNTLTIKAAGNVLCNGYVDAFGGSTTLVEYNGGAQALTFPTGSFLVNGGLVGHQVDSGATLTLNSAIANSSQVTVNSGGRLNFGTNQIGGGAWVVNAGATIGGNGTNQLTAGLTTNSFAGTLDLGALPALNPGDSFKLFGATTYAGAFASILPGTYTWDVTSLTVDGTLKVFNPGGAQLRISSSVVSGGSFIITGSGGTGGANYTVLTNSDPGASLTNWGSAGTFQFDGGGNFAFTNSPSLPQLFYSIRKP